MKPYGQIVSELAGQGRLRSLIPLADKSGCRVHFKNRQMLNLTSNDYLGLATDPTLHLSFYSLMQADNCIDDFGLGSASSRLLTGDTVHHHALEQDLGAAYANREALLFNSGYHANIGIIPALLGKDDLILSDKLNHASIHDGLRLSAADHKRFRHADYTHLRQLLAAQRNKYQRVIIASESVFSMDGDVADIAELVRIKNEYDCMLYLDEAHAIGVYGKEGLGKAEEAGLLAEIDLLVGTFGKAFASVGAYVICSSEIKDFLVNHSRSLIFTTALPPVILHWICTVFKKIRTMHHERIHLAHISDQLRQELRNANLQTDGTTNILPVMIGDNAKTVQAAQILQENGYLIFPVRPPTVPEGTARFRISLTANMQWSDLKLLPDAIGAALARCH